MYAENYKNGLTHLQLFVVVLSQLIKIHYRRFEASVSLYCCVASCIIFELKYFGALICNCESALSAGWVLEVTGDIADASTFRSSSWRLGFNTSLLGFNRDTCEPSGTSSSRPSNSDFYNKLKITYLWKSVTVLYSEMLFLECIN